MEKCKHPNFHFVAVVIKNSIFLSSYLLLTAQNSYYLKNFFADKVIHQ